MHVFLVYRCQYTLFLWEKSVEKEQNKYGWKGVYQETIKNTFISKDFENRDRYKKRHTGRRLRIICNGFQRGYQSLFQKEKKGYSHRQILIIN